EPTPEFERYVRKFTDLPFLVALSERDGHLVPGKFLTAADLPGEEPHGEWKPVFMDESTDEVVAPNGTLGHRWDPDRPGKWNLDLGGREPRLSLYGEDAATAEVHLPRFDGEGEEMIRGVPVRRIGGRTVTTVFDLLLAQYGVARPGLPGTWPSGYEDASEPCTPAWQAAITGVDAGRAARIAREFAANAEESRGRSMIVMGAGTNHWFHSDTIYRSFLTLTTLTGCQGVN